MSSAACTQLKYASRIASMGLAALFFSQPLLGLQVNSTVIDPTNGQAFKGASVVAISGSNVIGNCTDINGIPHTFFYSGSGSSVVIDPTNGQAYKGASVVAISGSDVIGNCADINGIPHAFSTTVVPPWSSTRPTAKLTRVPVSSRFQEAT